MKDYLFGYTNVNFSFNANISIRVPESGFLLQIGQTGNDFYDAISFSGVSGYIFDKRGDFVGGYVKNQPFTISGNYKYNGNDTESTGRLSYYLNNSFIANNLYSTGFVDTIRFEGYTDDTVASIGITLDTGDFSALMDNQGVYIQSNNSEYLISS